MISRLLLPTTRDGILGLINKLPAKDIQTIRKNIPTTEQISTKEVESFAKTLTQIGPFAFVEKPDLIETIISNWTTLFLKTPVGKELREIGKGVENSIREDYNSDSTDHEVQSLLQRSVQLAFDNEEKEKLLTESLDYFAKGSEAPRLSKTEINNLLQDLRKVHLRICISRGSDSISDPEIYTDTNCYFTIDTVHGKDYFFNPENIVTILNNIIQSSNAHNDCPESLEISPIVDYDSGLSSIIAQSPSKDAAMAFDQVRQHLPEISQADFAKLVEKGIGYSNNRVILQLKQKPSSKVIPSKDTRGYILQDQLSNSPLKEFLDIQYI